MVELMPYFVPNFWTERNAAAKRRQMKKRGMPDLDGGRFVTLTVNRELCPDEGGTWRLLEPPEAYEMGKARLRRFIARLRKRYKIRRWFWKMELHKPDTHGFVYAHWHFWFDYGGHIPGEEITKAWGLGRTDIRKINRKKFDYLFKYLCKQAGDLPDWLTSMTKVRLFQTSMGFFAGNDAEPAETPSPRQLDDIDETQNDCAQTLDTIGERILRWTRCVVARSTSPDGTVRHKLLIMRTTRWGELLAELARIKIHTGMTSEDIQIKETKVTTTWLTQLPPSLQGYT